MTDDEAERLIRGLIETSDGAEALRAIGRLGAARVGLSHLWDLTEHPYARFRAAAFDAMARFRESGAAGSERFVLEGLADENPYVLQSAAHAAASLKIEDAAPTLRELLFHDNRYVRSAAALALGSVGNVDDFETLLQVLRTDQDTRVRERTARGLGHLGGRMPPPPAVRDAALEMFRIAEGLPVPARWQATRGLLGILRHAELTPEVQDHLLTLMTDEVGVRGAVARVLGAHGVEAARSIIEDYLPAEPSARLRRDLIRALGDLGPSRSVEVLLGLTEMPLDTETAQALLSVLAEIDDHRAHVGIVRLATGPDVNLRASALVTLNPGHPLVADLAMAGLGDPASFVRTNAALALAGHAEHVEALQTALEHETVERVRQELRRALDSALSAEPPKVASRRSSDRPVLFELMPHGQSRSSEAVRRMVTDVMLQGGTAADVAAALEELEREAAAAASAYRRVASGPRS